MAVSVFDKALSFDPDNRENLVRFGELNRDAGMPFHAAQAFMRAAALASGEEGGGGEAAGLVVRALALDHENAEALELFWTLLNQGEAEGEHEK